MPAGLEPLRDDRVDAVRLEPARLVDRRCRRDDLRARGAHAREQLLVRQAEMKAHDRRLRTLSSIGRGLGAEGARPGPGAIDATSSRTRGNTARSAARHAASRVGIDRRRRVAEEIDVERPRRLRRDRGELLRESVAARAARTAASPAPPAFDTAIASAPACTPAIGAWTIGTSMPKSCRTVIIDPSRFSGVAAMQPDVVYTVGHSTRSADAFVALLGAHAVTSLADVRTVPRSRHNPQFSGETLAATLAVHEIAYARFPGLGGFRRRARRHRTRAGATCRFAVMPITCRRRRSRRTSTC